MKKFVFLVFFLSFSLNVYPFWIWSPKTQKWKNPKYSALATPYLQFKDAEKLFNEQKYKQAYKSFKKLLVNYPSSQEAAEAQYFIAYCLEKLSKPYDAYVEYQKLIDSYPNSKRINQAVERIYNIGEYFLNREHKKLLGMSVYDFVDHPAVEIFQRIVDKVPYCEYAPRAQYKLGMIFMELGRYDEAREAFQKTIDSYPDSEWAAPAKYQLALATAKAFPGAEYDATYLKEASSRLDEFIREHPDAQISAEAEEQLAKLRNSEAKKYFEIAEFYERQHKYESALIYYRRVVSNYSDSSYYKEALGRAGELTEIIRQGITRKEYEKQKKLRQAEERKAQQLRSKQDRLEARQALKRAKMQETLAKLQERKRSKEALRQEQLKKKEQARLAKLKRIEEAKAKKEARRLEKLRRKEEARLAKQKRIAEVKARKQVLRQEKLRKKEAALARKRALRAEKLREQQMASSTGQPAASAQEIVSEQQLREEKTQEQIHRIQDGLKARKQAYGVAIDARQTKQKRIAEAKARKQALRQEKLRKKEAARLAKLKRIEEAKAKKEARRLEKLRRKEEARLARLEKIQKAKQAKLKRKEEAKIQREARRLEKLRRKEEARLAKAAKREEAARRKEMLRLEKQRKKEQARQEKIKKIQEARAKKEARRLEKLRRKKEARLAKQKRIAEAKARKQALRQAKLKKRQEAIARKRAARQEALRKKQALRIEHLSDIAKQDFSQPQFRQQRTDEQLQKIQESLEEIKTYTSEDDSN